MVNSVYKLTGPPVLAKVPPFSAATDLPTPEESVDDGGGMVVPSPSPSTASTLTAEKGRAELPATPIQIMGDSEMESNKTEDPEPEGDSSHSAQVVPSTSGRTLRKQMCGKLEGSKDSKDGAPSPQKGNSKEGEGG